MALLSLRNVTIGYENPLVLDGVNLQIERGERVCLVGRNGAGKTTLLKLIDGELAPDSGEVALRAEARVARLPQEAPAGLTGRVVEVVAAGLRPGAATAPPVVPAGGGTGLGSAGGGPGGNGIVSSFNHPAINGADEVEWQPRHQINTVLTRLKLDPEAEFSTLSGGLKRRVLLARVLVGDPDLLLLDEPTNHLDIDSINWLEEFLLRHTNGLLFVTHDRMFLRRLATRIIELDRGSLTSWSCDYETFLQRKEAALEAEEKQRALFDKKLAEEEAWLRRGVKARETRNEGRVRALEKLRRERRERRERAGLVGLVAQDAARSGKLVMEASNASFSYGDRPVIRDFSTAIMRGDKVGIIGANGSGKTTLLRLLLGTLAPRQGTVRQGTRLQVALFDQMREQLDEDKSVQQNICGDGDSVTINGQARHIIGYLQEFLFPPERSRTPVRVLSGGERNRLLLARLFSRPSNLLVMDEPTNDLDAETLDLLEGLLLDYPGTLLLVSHDRAFLNNVVTSTLVLEGEAQVNEYIGGYDDWLRQRPQPAAPVPAKTPEKGRPVAVPDSVPRKLSLAQRRELEALPHHIEALEAEQQRLYEALADPAFYKEGDGSETVQARARLQALEQELGEAFARWETLEEIHARAPARSLK